MSPCGIPDGWPNLQNQLPEAPVRNLRQLLEDRIAAARWYRHVWQFIDTWILYRPWRATRRGVGRFMGHLTATPVKNAVDVLTGLPIALLAWPPARDWAMRLPKATLAFLAIIVGRLIYTVYRRNSARQDKRHAVRQTQRIALAPIEMIFAQSVDAEHGIALGPTTHHIAIKAMLDSIIYLTRTGLEIPKEVELHANLMLPMEVVAEDGTHVDGLGIVEYNTQSPPNPSWTKVIVGDLVAGSVLESRKLEVVEDTQDPAWWGVFDVVRSRCFASFPINAPDNSILGVVNIDADKPLIFKRSMGRELWSVLAPPLRLFAALLRLSRQA